MASYKVIQDVEAEDKLIGPLTVKQLFYGLLAAGIVFVGWLIANQINIYILIPFVLMALPFLFLAIPLGRDQPNDIWLLAKLNFFFRPKKRLWVQINNSYQPLIITSKKQVENTLTDGRTDEDVETQVQQLSRILDSQNPLNQKPSKTALKKVEIVDDEHEKRHDGLNHHFSKLLKSHHHHRKHGAKLKVKQDLKLKNAVNSSKTNPPSGRFQTPRDQHLTATISEITNSGELKISTLQGLVKKAKNKTSLKKNQQKRKID